MGNDIYMSMKAGEVESLNTPMNRSKGRVNGIEAGEIVALSYCESLV